MLITRRDASQRVETEERQEMNAQQTQDNGTAFHFRIDGE
jgi:hypothetical protein